MKVLTVGRGAALTGVDHRLGRRRRVVGEHIRVGPTHDRDVAGTEPAGLPDVGNEPGIAAHDGNK